MTIVVGGQGDRVPWQGPGDRAATKGAKANAFPQVRRGSSPSLSCGSSAPQAHLLPTPPGTWGGLVGPRPVGSYLTSAILASTLNTRWNQESHLGHGGLGGDIPIRAGRGSAGHPRPPTWPALRLTAS